MKENQHTGGGGLASATSAVARFPLVSLALVALVVRYGFPLAGVGLEGGFPGWVWGGATFVLWPFSVIATVIDPYLRDFPEWTDRVVTLVAGLLPYALLDLLLRWGVRRGRRGT